MGDCCEFEANLEGSVSFRPASVSYTVRPSLKKKEKKKRRSQGRAGPEKFTSVRTASLPSIISLAALPGGKVKERSNNPRAGSACGALLQTTWKWQVKSRLLCLASSALYRSLARTGCRKLGQNLTPLSLRLRKGIFPQPWESPWAN